MRNLFIIILLTFYYATTFAQTEGELSVTFNTSETGGKYAPKNVVAIWIESNSGAFVKTLMAYGDKRKTHLNNWQESTNKAGVEYNILDATTGATLSSHNTRKCNWDATDFKGASAADGQYQLCLELTDKNETGNYSTIEFNKENQTISISPGNVPSFSSIQIEWTPLQTSSIDETELNNAYAVYPSPTSGEINIEGKNIHSVEITDLKGSVVYKGNSGNINISGQPNGLYLIHLKTPDQIVIKKIVKH